MHLQGLLMGLKVVNDVIASMDESQKRMIDGYLDHLEDKFDEGSLKDGALEMACAVLRGKWQVPEFDDVKPAGGAHAKDKPKSTKVIPKGHTGGRKS